MLAPSTNVIPPSPAADSLVWTLLEQHSCGAGSEGSASSGPGKTPAVGSGSGHPPVSLGCSWCSSSRALLRPPHIAESLAGRKEG